MSVVALISVDPNLHQHFAQVFDGNKALEFTVIDRSIVDFGDRFDFLRPLDLMIVDLGADRKRAISMISRLRKSGVRGAIVTISDNLEETDVRALLHLQAADWLSMVDGRLPDTDEIIHASHKAINANLSAPPVKMPVRCVSFLPVAGGVGQTVLASIAGLLMAQRRIAPRRKPCIIDLNFHYSRLTDYLDLDPRLDLVTLEAAPERIDATLIEAMLSRHASTLAVLAAMRDRTHFHNRRVPIIPDILNVTCEMFDDVLIDLPAMWQSWTADVLAGSDEIYIITDFSVPGIRQAKELMTMLPDVLAKHIKTSVIVNRYQEKIFGGHLRKRDASDVLGDALAGFVSDGGDTFQEAINLGQPERLASRSSKVAKDLKQIIEGL